MLDARHKMRAAAHLAALVGLAALAAAAPQALGAGGERVCSAEAAEAALARFAAAARDEWALAQKAVLRGDVHIRVGAFDRLEAAWRPQPVAGDSEVAGEPPLVTPLGGAAEAEGVLAAAEEVPPLLGRPALWEVRLEEGLEERAVEGSAPGEAGGRSELLGADGVGSSGGVARMTAASAVGEAVLGDDDAGASVVGDGAAPRSRSSPQHAMVVIAGGERSLAYLTSNAALLLNKARRAARRGERLFLWTGSLPSPLGAPPAACLARNATHLVGCAANARGRVDPSCPTRGVTDGLRAPSIHYAKMPAALLVLGEAGISDVAVVDMDAVFSAAARLPVSEGGPPPFVDFFESAGAPGASVGFFMSHSNAKRWSAFPMGDAFVVRDTPQGRDFLLAWLALRCALKDQPPLWHLLLTMHQAAGTLVTAQYPAVDGTVTVFDRSYSDLLGGNVPFNTMQTLTAPDSASCEEALPRLPVVFLGAGALAAKGPPGGWVPAGEYDHCRKEAAKAAAELRGLGGASSAPPSVRESVLRRHYRCVVWHLGSITDNREMVADFFRENW